MRRLSVNWTAGSAMRRGLGLAMVAGVVLSLAVPASAISISNTTTNTVVFSDNYENVSASTEGLADDDGSVDFDPVASVGTWVILEDESPAHIQVTNLNGMTSTMVSYPGSVEGDNYMRLSRPGSAPFNQAQGTLSSPQANVNDVIHIEFMAYLRDFSGTGPGLFSLYEGDVTSTRLFFLQPQGDNSIVGASSLTWTPDVWQKWEVDYVIGASTFDLTVDGVTETGIANSAAPTINQVGSFRFATRNTTEIMIDAVPEPNSIILLGLSAVAAIGLRMRFRK